MKGLAEAFFRKEHAEERALVAADGVDWLIDALMSGPRSENMAELHSVDRPLLVAGFPDHELLVGVDREAQVGVLGFMDETGNFVSRGELTARGNASYCIVGNVTEFPDGSEILLTLVRQAVREFLLSGGKRPTCVPWKEPDAW